MDLAIKKGVRQAGIGGKLIGAVTDIQSFVTWTELNEQGLPADPVSFVRLNLGRHPVRRAAPRRN